MLCVAPHLLAQDRQESDAVEVLSFNVKGSVVEDDSDKPIPKVNIEVNGGAYTTTNIAGEFRIQVREGDELVIRHKDFETVTYKIKDGERIQVRVQSINKKKLLKRPSKFESGKFESLIDSANANLKLSPENSIQFVSEALTESNSRRQNAEAYETLGDIYMYWKQYDLAISNFEISLQNITNIDKRLKLAEALFLNKNYQESLLMYTVIEEDKLSNWQKVVSYEGFGDVYRAIKEFDKAIDAYNKGLEVANMHLIIPKVTDLNSKIAQTYEASGEIQLAEDSYSNSLDLAEKQNLDRSLKEKVRVADFQNTNRAYGKEIELRKEAIRDIETVELDSSESYENESAFTLQKQNYKIANAYAAQDNYPEAINFLEKSIEESDKKSDLIVQKDATRKLSELYRDIGDYQNALVAYQSYVELVDKLVVEKEQEISEAARSSRKIADNQNRITSLENDKYLVQSIFTEQDKRQKVIIYALIGGLLLLTLAAFLMYKNMKQQKFANNLLALKSLRSQMNPHFIFNALNSVNSFIATNDERTANKYLSDFSQLMRSVLENSEEDFIPLQKEIELLDLYTKLEHFRFKDKFDYKISVDENVKIEEFQIPPMLLQPYIENAVWHGLRYKKEKGHLDISIQQKQEDLIKIIISDDGIGRKKSKELKTENQRKQNSKGMGNIKKRVAILNDMYKDKVDVFIDDYQEGEDAGTKVVVTLKKD